MLGFNTMTRIESGSYPSLHERQQARVDGKIDINVAMQFLGSLLLENPQGLDGLSLTERHIVLSHSDPNNRSTFLELGQLFGRSSGGARNLYNRGVVRLWNDAPGVLQEKYPLIAIFDSVFAPGLKTRRTRSVLYSERTHTQEEKIKIGEGVSRSFRKPEVKAKLVANAKRRRHTKEGKEKIGKANKGRKRTAESRLKMGRSQSLRYSRPEERRKTSDAKIRTSIQKDHTRITEEDRELWRYASSGQLIGAIIEKGFLTQAQIDSLRAYFEEGHTPKNLLTLLNKFSIAVARLA